MVSRVNNELNAREIHRFADSDAQIEIYDSLPSTNDEAMKDIWTIPGIIVAREQTAGKGQHGHSFDSPKDDGIYVTFIIPVKERFIKNPGLLTMGVGLAVSNTIYEVLNLKTQLKWVNDIFFKDQKVGGILTEVQNDENNLPVNFIIGIGLDIRKPSDQSHVFGSLNQTDETHCNELIGKMFKNMNMILDEASQNILNSYSHKMLWKNKKISVSTNNEMVTGIEKGIDDFGRMILETPDGTLKLEPNYSQQIRLKN